MNLLSWIVGMFTAIGVVITGMAADKGQHIGQKFFVYLLILYFKGKPWAAGNRAYRPIRG